MSKMAESELKAMLAAEYADALAALTGSSKLSAERSNAMDYYQGDMHRHMPAPVGTSSAVSTDVADTIEGLMPSLMEIFCASDDVVKFNPVGPEDVAAAEQETDYTNHVFMQTNPGFLILYSFIKDALLSKVGIVKVWWETKKLEERETYFDLPDDGFALLVADPDVEIVAHTVRGGDPDAVDAAPIAPPEDAPEGEEGGEPSPAGAPPMAGAPMPAPQPGMAPGPAMPPALASPGGPGLVPGATPLDLGAPVPPPLFHDVEVIRSKTAANAKIEPVPPEEFGISRNARSLRDCDYCFHKVLSTEAKLIAQGFDSAQVKALPSYSGITNSEEMNRDTVDEGQFSGESLNESARRIEVIEHYVRMDYKGDGKACLYKVTTGGGEGELMTRDGKPDVDPCDEYPFAAMTPVIMTHRFFGRSIADLVMDIQRIKTAVLRGMLNNVYMANNPRVEVPEPAIGSETIDDLLSYRPGGMIRTKVQGMLQWQTVPNIAAGAFPVLEYMDGAREMRTGVTRQGQGIDANALQNQSATAVNQVFSASQARVKLIARIFAETGIRDLFTLVHATIRKHGEKPHTVQLRKQWVTVNPRDWKTRNDMTINVGLGTGSKAEQAGLMTAILNMQKEALAGGLTNLVTPKQIYNAAMEFVKVTGRKDGEQFFADPTATGPNGQPLNPVAPPPPNPEMIKAQVQQQQADAQQQLAQAKATADVTVQNNKAQTEALLAQQKFEHDKQMALLAHGLAVEQHHMSMTAKAMDIASKPGPDGQPRNIDPMAILATVTQHHAPAPPPAARGLKVVRGPDGRVSHIEPMQGV